ncbi:hypothetical protein JCM19037_4249 [Geomicrobium sp. JCM 19037]|uniref:hypothetical protein n=1 Tax=Geomicrobium sp. JCM 19037 TaxID=1460634 RepID=UPI00045F2260|nr:hypothetical protein [Geomicrobium sp. JCM 19037]GAK05722.1 hypothetical protein JCM19037_4249 [Geomicrobium sp. JCM 19037]
MMKVAKLLPLTLIATILIVACGTEEDEEVESAELPAEMPDDFNFSLTYGYAGANGIDTYEGTVTKDLIPNGDVTIDLSLTESEMEEIYDQMVEVNLLETAEYVSDVQCVDPHGQNYIEMTINGERVEREWISAQCDGNDEQLSEWLSFIHFELIEPKEEYQALPDPEGGYD